MQVISVLPTRASDMGLVSFTERLKVDKDHSLNFINDSVSNFLIFKFYFQFYLNSFMSLIVTRSDQLRLDVKCDNCEKHAKRRLWFRSN